MRDTGGMGIQRTGVAVVTVALVATALVGCVEPTPVPPPPTEEEIDAMREEQAQAWWDSLSTGTTMPELGVIEELPNEEAFIRQTECLDEAQVPGVTVYGPGEWSYNGALGDDPTGAEAQVEWSPACACAIWSTRRPSTWGRSSWKQVARELAASAWRAVRSHRRRRAAGAEFPGHPRRRPRFASRAAFDRAALGRQRSAARDAGRQGRVLRHRRPGHQAGRRHAQHEEGHGRRGARVGAGRAGHGAQAAVAVDGAGAGGGKRDRPGCVPSRRGDRHARRG